MKRSQAPPSPWRDLLALAWKAPLFALPFAFFFMITSGQPPATFLQFYLISLVFSSFSLTGVWVAHHWLVPPIVARHPDDPSMTLKSSGLHAGMALLFGAAAAVFLNYTILPGFLGTGRALLTLLTYFVLFGLLFTGIAVAVNLQRKAVERAG